jgi:hypothetical protein
MSRPSENGPGLREKLRDSGAEVEPCGARTPKGPCQELPVPGNRRCRLHGGWSTGPRTRAGHARCLAGRVRSYERSEEIRRQVRKEMEAEREQMKVPPEVDREVAEARRLLSRELALLGGEEAAADWLELSNLERLQRLTPLSLTKMLEIMSLAAEPGNLKLIAIQKDLVMAVTSQQVWVDD